LEMAILLTHLNWMFSNFLSIQSIRYVRTFTTPHQKPPYAFYLKRHRTATEIGPLYYEKWEWPHRESGWSVFPSQKQKELLRYPIEIIVPDLKDTQLRPYVTFRLPESALNTRAMTARDLYEVACKR
ncbi:hypothetical protein T10_13489, partial [Trichinella papuae]